MGAFSAAGDHKKTKPKPLDVSALPKPSVLLMGNAMHWNGPVKPDHKCPVCHGKHLRLHEYCLLCDNCGTDYRPVVTPIYFTRTCEIPTKFSLGIDIKARRNENARD